MWNSGWKIAVSQSPLLHVINAHWGCYTSECHLSCLSLQTLTYVIRLNRSFDVFQCLSLHL